MVFRLEGCFMFSFFWVFVFFDFLGVFFCVFWGGRVATQCHTESIQR